jgi:hypothetical protein
MPGVNQILNSSYNEPSPAIFISKGVFIYVNLGKSEEIKIRFCKNCVNYGLGVASGFWMGCPALPP